MLRKRYGDAKRLVDSALSPSLVRSQRGDERWQSIGLHGAVQRDEGSTTMKARLISALVIAVPVLASALAGAGRWG